MGAPIRILFTDLDGTLLDHATYAFEAALPAVRALQARQIPIVFCTSKTFSETVALQEAMGVSDPFVVENGGAIYFRPGQLDSADTCLRRRGAWNRLGLGVPYPALVTQLATIRELTGLRIRGFSDMDAGEIAADCGLSLDAAERARQREYDEPFRLLDGDDRDFSRVVRMVRGAGLSLTTGGRYHHLSGGSDKGRAVRKISEWMRRAHGPLRTVGLGDSPNDRPMLEAVDIPVAVMRPGEAHHPGLVEGVPGLICAAGVGPEGWNEAVLRLLAGEADHAE